VCYGFLLLSNMCSPNSILVACVVLLSFLSMQWHTRPMEHAAVTHSAKAAAAAMPWLLLLLLQDPTYTGQYELVRVILAHWPVCRLTQLMHGLCPLICLCMATSGQPFAGLRKAVSTDM
jgi:hypothetical protein